MLQLNVQWFGATGDGATNDRAAINLAISAVGAGTTIVFTPGTYVVGSALTFPAGVRVRFSGGAMLSISSSVVVTFNGPIDAEPAQQLFTGAGSVSFGAGSQSLTYPDWWGTGNATCVQSACDAAHKAQIPVCLLPKTYNIGSNTLSIDRENAVLFGMGRGTVGNLPTVGPTIQYTGTGTAVQVGKNISNLDTNHPNTCVLNGAVSAGATSVVVNSAAGYAAGSWISLTNSLEKVKITSVVGATLNFETPLLNSYSNGAAVTREIFSSGITLEHFRIQVARTTAIALDVWNPADSHFCKVSAIGNDGPANYLLRVTGGLASRFEKCDFNGIGGTGGAGGVIAYATALNLQGLAGGPATTVHFHDCYFHYCYTGALVNTCYAVFSECIFETLSEAIATVNSCNAIFTDCYFENVASGGGAPGIAYISSQSEVWLKGCHINQYANDWFVTCIGAGKVHFEGCRLYSLATNPRILDMSAFTAGSGKVSFNDCLLPATMVLGPDWRDCYIENTKTRTYKWTQGALAANSVYVTLTTEGLMTDGRVYMPQNGVVLAMVAHVDAAITAGTYDVAIRKNADSGSGIAAPNIAGSAARYSRSDSSYKASGGINKFIAGDYLSVQLATSAAFAGPARIEVEAIVAWGDF